jgi:hypothetical protein
MGNPRLPIAAIDPAFPPSSGGGRGWIAVGHGTGIGISWMSHLQPLLSGNFGYRA